jgi:hypothetical protein
MRAPLLLLLLASCKDSSTPGAPPPPASTAAAPAAAAPATPEPAAQAPAAQDAAPAPSPPAEPAQDDEAIGRDLMAKETIGGLSIGAASDKVTEVAGAAKKKSRPEMSEGLGVYVTLWTYRDTGLEVWMSAEKKKGPYRVLTLRIARPSTLKTSKGIGIGSPLAELEKAYPRNASESSAEQFVAGTMYGGLLFEIANGKVDSIFLGASAE